jgi:hypothetical protein
MACKSFPAEFIPLLPLDFDPAVNERRLEWTNASSLLTFPVTLGDFIAVPVPLVCDHVYVRACPALIDGLYGALRKMGKGIVRAAGLRQSFVRLYDKNGGCLGEKYVREIEMPEPSSLVLGCARYGNMLDRLVKQEEAVDWVKWIQAEGIETVKWIREADSKVKRLASEGGLVVWDFEFDDMFKDLPSIEGADQVEAPPFNEIAGTQKPPVVLPATLVHLFRQQQAEALSRFPTPTPTPTSSPSGVLPMRAIAVVGHIETNTGKGKGVDRSKNKYALHSSSKTSAVEADKSDSESEYLSSEDDSSSYSDSVFSSDDF